MTKRTLTLSSDWVLRLAACCAIALLAQGASAAPNARAQTQEVEPGSATPPLIAPNDPRITYTFTQVEANLDNPIYVTHAGDERLFIVLQEGRIIIRKNGALLPTNFLDINGLVRCCGEEGLLGLAFEPNYATTGRFYVYYTNNSGDQVIARYSVSSGNPDVANPASAQVVLTIPHPNNGNHNGGWIGFGPDGHLYAGVGDGGGGGDPDCTGQNPNELRGKLLRLGVTGQTTYTIPAGNVFTATQRPEVWAYGLRNPWRNSFDRQTGDLYVGDVGQQQWEEVSFVPSGSAAGTDFGWSTYEGTRSYNNPCPNKTTGVKMPFAEYNHSLGCSVTGGYVYRGSRFAFLSGAYFFGDFCSGRIWASWVPTATSPFTTALIKDTDYTIASFGEDANGELYLVDYGCTDPNDCNPIRPAGVYLINATDPLGVRVTLPAVLKDTAP